MKTDICIYIAGTDIAFCSGDWVFDFGEITYLPRSIVAFSEIETSLDIRNPVSTSGGCSFSVPRIDYSIHSSIKQPEFIFGTYLPPVNTYRILNSVLSNDTTMLLLVDSGASALPAGAYYHIGLECVYVSGVAGNQVTMQRAQKRTLAQPHYVNSNLSQHPVVSTVPFAWVGRPVYISTSDKPYWKIGFLTAQPSLDNDLVTFSWAPVDVKISSTVPGSLVSPSTGLFQGDHYVSTPLHIAQVTQLQEYVVWGVKSGSSFTVSSATGAGDFDAYVARNALDSWYNPKTPSNLYLVNLENNNGNDESRITSISKTDSLHYTIYTYNNVSDGLCGITGGARFISSPPIGTVGGTISWTSIRSVLNNFVTSRPAIPTSINTLDPTFGLYRSDSGSLSTWLVKRAPNSDRYRGVGQLWGLLWSETALNDSATDTNASLYVEFRNAGDPINKHGFGMDSKCADLSRGDPLRSEYNNYQMRFSAPNDTTRTSRWDGVCRYPMRIVANANYKQENYDLSAQGVNGIKSHITFFKVCGNTYTQMPSICTANHWWELGERYICLADTLSTGEFACQATWYEPGQDSPFECELWLKYVDYSSSYGYRYEVMNVETSKNPAGIGDWNNNKAVIKRIPRTPNQRDYEALENVICSTDGNSEKYTVCGGVGLDPAWVDADDSFCLLHFEAPGLRWVSFDVSETTAAEAFAPVLILSCTALVGKYSGGNYKICRVPLGAPNVSEVVAAFNDDHFIGLPQSTWQTDFVTQYKFTWGNSDAGEKVLDLIATDTDAIQIFGAGATMDLDLSLCFGAFPSNVDPVETLKSYIARMVETYGKPQRKWVFSVPFSVGKDLELGDVINVTSKYLYGNNAARGVTNGIARIIGLSQDLLGDVTRVTCLATYKVNGVYTGGFCARYYSGTTLYVSEDYIATQLDYPIINADFFYRGQWVFYTSQSTTGQMRVTNATYNSNTHLWTLATSNWTTYPELGSFVSFILLPDPFIGLQFQLGATDLR